MGRCPWLSTASISCRQESQQCQRQQQHGSGGHVEEADGWHLVNNGQIDSMGHYESGGKVQAHKKTKKSAKQPSNDRYSEHLRISVWCGMTEQTTFGVNITRKHGISVVFL